MTLEKVAVIGAGTMGSGIAQVFAHFGCTVVLIDIQPSLLNRALATIGTSLDRMVKKGTITTSQREQTLSRITVDTNIHETVPGVDFVVEAVSEDPAVKKALFRELDARCRPEVVLATNTSSISITSIAGATLHPDRVVGMHFMNPVPIMPLVEVVLGQGTSQDTAQVVKDLCARIQKTAVEVADFPGFVANRLLMPMLNEAMYAVMEGVAAPAAIDTVMKLGMKHPMGPLELADFIGLDVCLAIMNVLHEGFGDPKYRPCPLLKRMVAAGQLGKKSGRGFYSYT
jgi:3-hydroxybutyryl-CoA dehydrogenase